MIDLNGMSVFVAVAEAGSLTGAGDALNLPKSTISRRLHSYETAIGATLFRRSTRSISLTDAGKEHFKRVQTLVHEASEAISEITDQSQQAAGLIRVSASLGIGESLLAPMVWEFLNKHPKVSVEMILTDDFVDLVADGIDFALRMGDLENSELMGKYLGTVKRVLVASPKCLSQYPIPSKPDDLRRIPSIVTIPTQNFWHFANGESIRVNSRIAAGNFRTVLDACLFGHGVASLPEKIVKPHLETGTLIQLLEDTPLPEVSVTVVYPRVKHQSAAARKFLTALGNLRT